MNRTKPYWLPHPIADLFPRMTPEEKAALKDDMRKRREQGLLPLERPILLYMGMILDGRHRHDCWMDLAAAGAAGGYFARNPPPFENFSPGQHGTLAAWMRAKSLNMVHRNIPADQKAAIFLKAVELYPELKAVIEAIKDVNANRQKEGRPLDAGDQRGNTNQQIAEMAGVGVTTVKQVKRLQDQEPKKFEEVAQGKTTVKKALKEASKVKKPRPRKNQAEGSSSPVNNTPGTVEPWDIEFTAFGYVTPPAGMQPTNIFSGLKDGTLKLILTGRLEKQDGSVLAELTDFDGKEFKVTSD